MAALIAASALACVLFGALGLGEWVSLPIDVQSFLLLGMAVAGTIMLGAFDAYESRSGEAESVDEG